MTVYDFGSICVVTPYQDMLTWSIFLGFFFKKMEKKKKKKN